MGERGPQKTPTAILQARGSWRGDARTGEPTAPAGAPPCPEWLTDPVALAEWDRIIPLLGNMGILARTDLAIIAGYCEQFGKWREAETNLRNGPADGFKPGSVEHRRLCITADAAFGNMLRSAAKLGLSPADRAGVKAAGSDDGADDSKQRKYFGAAG